MATLISVVVVVVVIVASSSGVLALPRNLTTILSHYPEFSDFNTLISETSIAEEIDSMGSATLFVPDNSKLLRDLIFQLRVDPSMRDTLSDLCKFHATSEFLDLQGFKSNSTTRIPTLLHGRSFFIKVNIRGDMSIVDSNRSSLAKPAVIQGNVQSPGKLGVYSIDRVLNPSYALPDVEPHSGNGNGTSLTERRSNATETTTDSTSSSDAYRAGAAWRLFVAVFIALLARV